jgi:anti-sigma regulatory factor (Ser/Thr protein kinase)
VSDLLKKSPTPDSFLFGLYSKKEAAQLIAKGIKHVHSSTLGARDAGARVTKEILETGKITTYPWEPSQVDKKLFILSSRERYEAIRNLVSQSPVEGRRDLQEKLESILEELVSNALFHAYRKRDGEAKYQRRQLASLDTKEKIALQYKTMGEGIYLSVTDQGGSLLFSHVASAFQRCYGDKNGQIEAKEGGAGLGLYMAFEMSTHVKIVSRPTQQTTISCWLADGQIFDPDLFSFNFFGK